MRKRLHQKLAQTLRFSTFILVSVTTVTLSNVLLFWLYTRSLTPPKSQQLVLRNCSSTPFELPGEWASILARSRGKAGDAPSRPDMFLSQTNLHLHYNPARRPFKRPQQLPQHQPHFSFNSCALVGNSGGLLTAEHGPAIDEHQAVLRLNQAPLHTYVDYVGSKTTFRLLNKKWAACYADKRQGQAVLLPVEAHNTTLLLTRADTWQVERLLGVVQRQRPDIQVLVVLDSVISEARRLLEMFRAHLNTITSSSPDSNFTCANQHNPISPSSGMLGFFILLQFCDTVTVYGLGSPSPSWETSRPSSPPPITSEEEAESGAAGEVGVEIRGPAASLAQQAWARHSCRGNTPANPAGRYHISRGFPTPYHYFIRWFDSTKLVPHQSHNFDLESDFFFKSQQVLPKVVAFCPPRETCVNPEPSDPCYLIQRNASMSNETAMTVGWRWYQSLKPLN